MEDFSPQQKALGTTFWQSRGLSLQGSQPLASRPGESLTGTLDRIPGDIISRCTPGIFQAVPTLPVLASPEVSLQWVRASARNLGAGPRPAQSVWQGSGFAADQTNAMLAVVRADDESLVPPQAAGLALSVARPLPTETASLGFGGSPVGVGDKNSRFAFFRCFYVGGWYHYPRRALRASETLDSRLSKRLSCYSFRPS